ncbi:DUF6207 family protein [Streptomyces goshikiensis]
MKPIEEQHIAEPGLVVLDITGGDEDTVLFRRAGMEDKRVSAGGRNDPAREAEPGLDALFIAVVRAPAPVPCAGSGPARRPQGRRPPPAGRALLHKGTDSAWAVRVVAGPVFASVGRAGVVADAR